MLPGNGLRPVGHPERCVQIRGQRGADEGGGKKFMIFYAASYFFVYKSIHPQTLQIVFCVFLPRTMTAKSDPG